MELISIDNLLLGLTTLFSVQGLSMATLGVVLGILIGAAPGMSPSMGVALLVPFSYGMDPAAAFIFFVAAYQAANYGGSITAIAINAPGTPASVVTALDGFALTQKGQPGLALGTAVVSSAIGGLIGALILIVFAAPIAKLGLSFGPAEYCSLGILGLCTVVAFARKSWVKSALGVLLGLLFSTVQMDPFSGEPRFTLGFVELYDGISFIPAMIGLFALGEIFHQLENELPETHVQSFSGEIPPLASFIKSKWIILKSSVLGTFIGVVPGAGATIASFIAYGEAKRTMPDVEFGEGAVEGVIASEAANSSSVGGALVPLLSLGIPGSATDAVLLGALSLHGLVAGPELFRKSPDIVYGIFACLLFANLLILIIGLIGNRAWLKVISIPRALLYPFIIMLCLFGSYTVSGSLFDSWICLAFGVLGWVLKRFDFSPAPIVLGLVLGEMIELNLRRAILMEGASMLFTKPISATFLALALLSLLKPLCAFKNQSN